MLRSRSVFSGRSVSSRYSVTWPTLRLPDLRDHRAARKRDLDPQLAAVAAATGAIGRSSKSESWYSARCAPSASIVCRSSPAGRAARRRRTAAGSRSPPCNGRRRGCRGRRNRSAGSRARRTRRRSTPPGRSGRKPPEFCLNGGSAWYASKAASTRLKLSRNAGSAAASIRRCSSMRFSSAFGLWPTASHSARIQPARRARASAGPSCTRGCSRAPRAARGASGCAD